MKLPVLTVLKIPQPGKIKAIFDSLYGDGQNPGAVDVFFKACKQYEQADDPTTSEQISRALANEFGLIMIDSDSPNLCNTEDPEISNRFLKFSIILRAVLLGEPCPLICSADHALTPSQLNMKEADQLLATLKEAETAFGIEWEEATEEATYDIQIRALATFIRLGQVFKDINPYFLTTYRCFEKTELNLILLKNTQYPNPKTRNSLFLYSKGNDSYSHETVGISMSQDSDGLNSITITELIVPPNMPYPLNQNISYSSVFTIFYDNSGRPSRQALTLKGTGCEITSYVLKTYSDIISGIIKDLQDINNYSIQGPASILRNPNEKKDN